MDQETVICIMEYYSAMNNEDNLAIWDKIDEPWRQYTKWNNSDRKRQIQYEYLNWRGKFIF